MEKGIKKFVATLSTLGLLASCAQTDAPDVKNDNTSAVAQGMETFVDYDALARRYENRASKLLAMAAKHEKLLQHDEGKSHLYGKHSQSRDLALVQKYKLAAEKARQAAFHHRAASQLAKRSHTASGVS